VAIKVSGQEIAAKQGETTPGVASVQARAPSRRSSGREFKALGPDAKKDRWTTVYILRVGAAKLGSQTILKHERVYKSLSSSIR